MIDPGFDPLTALQQTAAQVEQHTATINALIQNTTNQSQLLMDLSQQLVKLTEQQAVCQQALIDIMDRLEDEQ